MNIAGDFLPNEGDIKIVNGIVYQYDYVDIDDFYERLKWVVLCPACDFNSLYPELSMKP